MRISLIFLAVFVTALPVHAQPRIEVIHSWETPAEQHALDAFKEAAEAKGALWFDTAIPSTQVGLQEELYNLIEAGIPPSASQWINLYNGTAHQLKSDRFKLISEFPNANLDKLLPEVKELIYLDGETFILPLGIHTYNFMVYNKAILLEKGLEPAQSWEELTSYGEVLKKDGIYLLSTSTQYWQLRTMVRSILAAYLSKDEFLELISPAATLNVKVVRPALVQTIKTMAELKKYAMPNHVNLPWEEASARVESGKALAQVLGDYIVPIFKNRDDIVCAATPANKFIYWGMDSFALVETNQEEMQQGQAILIDVVMNTENMKEYISRKGGIAVSKGSTPEELEPCNKVSTDAWNRKEKMYTGLETKHDRYTSLFGQLAKFWSDDNIDPESLADEVIDTLEKL